MLSFYSEIISIALAGFLFILSFLLLAFRTKHHDLVSFACSSIALSLVLILRYFPSAYWAYQMACLIIWPCFFMFSRIQYHRDGIRLSYFWHLLAPFIWASLNRIIPAELQTGIFEGLYLFQLLIYLGLSLFEVNKTQRLGQSERIFKPLYLRFLLLGLIILLIVRFSLPVLINDTTSVLYLFHLTVAIYFILIAGFFIDQPFQLNDKMDDIMQSHELANYEEEMKRKLKYVMQDDKAYLNPELTLNDLSSLMHVKPSELSNFINTNLSKNFNDYVNDYRVSEFKKLATALTTDPQATIMELAYQSGFNSKASFNRIFKEYTGTTPTQFKRDAKNHL